MKKSKGSKKNRSLPDRQKATNQRSRLTNAQIEETTRTFFISEPNKAYNYKQICYLFGDTSMAEKQQIVSVLESLTKRKFLSEVEMGRYKLSKEAASKDKVTKQGIFNYSKGIPSVTLEDNSKERTILLSETSSGQALDGDRVLLALKAKGRGGKRAEYTVAKILERSRRTYVGQVKFNRKGVYVTSEMKELRQPFIIPTEALGIAQDGDKVVVRLKSWSSRDKNPVGEIVDILGQSGNNDAEMHAILAEFGLPYSYPKIIEQEAEKLSGEITEHELARREDFRHILTFTIDPKDAKDFDDALSLRKLDSGNWEVGVHIADVSHFVAPGSLIDDEAYKRATSIYLVDRTIPMLPERLSNFLCSLRPGEEKYGYSCIFELDDEASVLSSRITRTVILSDKRFTYEEAQEIIETQQGEHADAILTLHQLAQKLRADRFKAGSIAFDRPEVRFEINEEGKPLSVYIKESLPAHQLIEEFMLLANRTVAERVGIKRGTASPKPFVYRVHDEPDLEKLSQLSSFASSMGYSLKLGTTKKSISSGLNKFLDEVKGKPEGDKFASIAVRTMAKAAYTTENIGHYGLAFKYYTHFTSPIRRYPDLLVHRLLTTYLVDKKSGVDKALLEHQCEHSSAMEALAAQAERASIRYKQVEYMQDYLGETFMGTISGLANWGIYVEINDTKCEGLIPMHDLKDDYYEYDEEHFCLVGKRKGKRYTIGDQLKVRVASANLQRRQLDYALED